MSIATSMAAGVKGQFGTPAKPLHAGLAARNAVDAAFLAAAGMTGRMDILEGPQGFLELFGGHRPAGWEETIGQIGNPHTIEREGLAPKCHPCCGSTHNTVDTIYDLRRKHGIAAEEVVSVETLVGIANRRNLAYPEPEDEMQARFSMHYCVALALLHDSLSLFDFTMGAVWRIDVRRYLPLTTMRSYSEAEEAASTVRLPHRVTVRLRDGRVLQGQRSTARGTIADPFDENTRRAKFLDCCSGRLGKAPTIRLYERLGSLDNDGAIIEVFAESLSV